MPEPPDMNPNYAYYHDDTFNYMNLELTLNFEENKQMFYPVILNNFYEKLRAPSEKHPQGRQGNKEMMDKVRKWSTVIDKDTGEVFKEPGIFIGEAIRRKEQKDEF